jgi:multidrug resistance efflux pump
VAAARQAELDARIALDALDTDRFRQDLDDAEIDVDDRQRELEDAQAEVDEKSDLDPDNATRKAAEEALEDAQQAYDDAVEARDGLRNQLSSAEQALALAGARLADAQRQADARANGPDPDELDLAQRRLDNARAQLAAAEAALADLELTAPYDGTVVSLSISAGEQVAPGQALIVFADYSSWYVETTDLTEMDVIQIHPGDSAIVVPDAVDSLELSGTVESINDAYRERSGDVLYTARLRLAERDERLRWGMTVAVTFED